MTAVDEALTPFRADPGTVALILDFDGTLSPIVEDAAAAVPHADVPDLLARLRDHFGLVAVVSGRPVEFLLPLLPTGLVLAGLYGLELMVDGERRDHPQAGNWREVVDDVAGLAEVRAPAGVVVERKGLSLTLHYRSAPDQEAAAAAYAAGRGPPVGPRGPPRPDVLGAAPADRGRQGHCGAGPGRRTCRRWPSPATTWVTCPASTRSTSWTTAGVATLRIAVDSPEAPLPLLERADLVVDGPDGLVALLESLLLTLLRLGSGGAERCRGVAREPAERGDQSAAARLSASQSAGVRAVARSRQRADRARRASPSRVSAWCSASLVPATSKGSQGTTASASSSHAPASGDRTSTPVPLVDHGGLLGHQVQAVADRVDQHDVGPAQGGHRAGEVVGRRRRGPGSSPAWRTAR